MKEGKSLIFPGLRSRLPHSRESARNRERERDRDRDRDRERQRETERERQRYGDPSSDGAKVF